MTEDKAKEMLESLIDSKSLSHVLGLLADVCEEKADHIASNWQDEDTAEAWSEAAEDLMDIANDIDI